MSSARYKPFDLAPLTGPLAVVEAVQRAPSGSVVHAHAKIIHVLAGRTRIETPDVAQVAVVGGVVIVAAGSPCSVRPDPWVDRAHFRPSQAPSSPVTVLSDEAR